MVGDWDGNGTDTPGMLRAGKWYLTNSLGTGLADMSFGYGNPTDIPIVGDWNDDGHDTPGVVRAGIWYVVNTLADPYADAELRLRQPRRRSPHRAVGGRPGPHHRDRPLVRRLGPHGQERTTPTVDGEPWLQCPATA